MKTKKRLITAITALVLIVVLAVPVLSPTPVLAANTGAVYPGTVTTEAVSPEDDYDWTNPDNIKGADGNADCLFPKDGSGTNSYRIKATNFGFDIPTGATIVGIAVEIRRQESSWNMNAYDYRVQLLDASGNLVGDNKASASEWPWSSPGTATYGGATDTWNASPTESMVEDADFGVVLSFSGSCGTMGDQHGYVDYIRMTVTYSVPTFTIEGASVDGYSSICVSPSDSLDVDVRVTIDSYDWRSTNYLIEGQSEQTADTGDHTSDGTYTEDFTITAPATPGTYDLTLTAYENNDGTGNHSAPITLTDAIKVGIFGDSFGTTEADDVPGWDDAGGDENSDCAVREYSGIVTGGSENGYLRLRDGGNATKTGISTASLTNIHLQYTWGEDTDGDVGGDGDLVVEWRVASGSWNTLATHSLTGTDRPPYYNAQDSSLDSSANNMTIEIRFTGDTDEDSDRAWVDNVVVSGDLLIVPSASTLYDTGGTEQLSFNNVKQHTTTPRFRVSATHTADFDRFQIELNNQADFGGIAYTQTFSGNYSSATQYNLLCNGLSPSLPTTDGQTYYVRARASADSGSNWGPWSSGTWSLTYNAADEDPMWFQTTDEQFDTGTLSDTETSGSDSVQINQQGLTVDLVGSWDTDSDITNGASYTPESGSNRVVLVMITAESDASGTIDFGSVTLGGQTLTAIENANGVNVGTGGHYHNSVWLGYLDESGIGNMSGSSLVVNWDTSPNNPNGNPKAQFATYENVNQTTPIADSNSHSATSAGQIQAGSVSVGTGDRLVYATVSGQPADHSPPAGYTEHNEIDGPSNDHSNASAHRDATTSSTEDPIADWSGTNRLAIISAVLNSSEPPSSGTITSPSIDFGSLIGATDWNQLLFTDDETSGDIKYAVEYWDGDSWEPTSITDQDSSPVDISSLDPATHNPIRIKATLTAGSTPYLQDWTVKCTEAILQGSITAHKFNDLDGDGTQGGGEDDLEGWTMTLYSGAGCDLANLVTSGQTDSDGNVTFPGLTPGDYSVKETLEDDCWEVTTPFGDPSICQDVTLSAGGSPTLNFGNRIILYTLTVTSPDCCTVKVDDVAVTTPYSQDYACGTVVDIEAIDGVCCAFDNWTLDDVSQGTTNPISVNMTANHNAIANCHGLGPYTLTVTSNGCCPITVGTLGSVAADESETFYDIACSTNVTLTADESDPSCEFDKWTVDGVSQGAGVNPITVPLIRGFGKKDEAIQIRFYSHLSGG